MTEEKVDVCRFFCPTPTPTKFGTNITKSSTVDTIVLDFRSNFVFWNDGTYCEGTVSKNGANFSFICPLYILGARTKWT